MAMSDPSFDLWPFILCTQAVQAASLTAACIPHLRPFLESLESGMIRSDDLRRRGIDRSYGYGDSSAKGSTVANNRSKGKATAVSSFVPLNSIHDSVNTATVRAEGPQWDDAQSTSSQTRIIKYTTTFAVATEARTPGARISSEN